MKKYEFLDHTADAKFRAYGRSMEEAFSNAALALFAIITDVKKVKPKMRREVAVTAKRERSLLYDFLSELIYLQDTEGWLLSRIDEVSIEEGKGGLTLTAILSGDTDSKYEILTQVKAMTYSDMYIKRNAGKVEVQAVPDL